MSHVIYYRRNPGNITMSDSNTTFVPFGFTGRKHSDATKARIGAAARADYERKKAIMAQLAAAHLVKADANAPAKKPATPAAARKRTAIVKSANDVTKRRAK